MTLRTKPPRRKSESIQTVRATWPDGVVMMFGTSYRVWRDQLDEYCREFQRIEPSLEVSNEPWIGYGGLKWCSAENFQTNLDNEGQSRTVDQFTYREITPTERQKARKKCPL